MAVGHPADTCAVSLPTPLAESAGASSLDVRALLSPYYTRLPTGRLHVRHRPWEVVDLAMTVY
jgi:hypothetical protein